MYTVTVTVDCAYFMLETKTKMKETSGLWKNKVDVLWIIFLCNAGVFANWCRVAGKGKEGLCDEQWESFSMKVK